MRSRSIVWGDQGVVSSWTWYPRALHRTLSSASKGTRCSISTRRSLDGQSFSALADHCTDASGTVLQGSGCGELFVRERQPRHELHVVGHVSISMRSRSSSNRADAVSSLHGRDPRALRRLLSSASKNSNFRFDTPKRKASRSARSPITARMRWRSSRGADCVWYACVP